MTCIEDHRAREEEVGYHHQEGGGGQCMVVQCAVAPREEEGADHRHQVPVGDIRHKAEGFAQDRLIGMAHRIRMVCRRTSKAVRHNTPTY